ncbi:MAG: alcohol dehydrogenase [Piscirickettsiaceae bacterium CG_4_9_14_3_um_filter_43_564]|nr:iron-containing alcohol dehydrogenase [Thiomicrospira sp.]PIQ04128.1 MAG: alcohol dehydrogenase [Piscirickettsiaceae bacterium CG18_big_fil_WC_8_21_14_2_50_44_103]PIU38691.1 MAG: alcohol dehydrogenase [Piscirickettsiaceae bacterium CG07_land_8_20_14_0_80_44_28]PIW57800.1 MAG: alcohol dehydrogenase [Piscirickettsiaceae bacterium CG12_big_fil_rev_8_21_14_0_65_44_934]PIW76826.1 MAG: alcohol dehydrogenase [Piscirickettsiaceae bacterium CG_4_8_14_3_um_filter_44_38]PIX78589.1 MAG: alcohol dehydro
MRPAIPQFTLTNQPKIHFQWDCLSALTESILQKQWRSMVLISSQFLARPGQFSANFIAHLQQADCRVTVFTVSGEPSPELIDTLVKASPKDTQGVIGIGGGSVLDTAKAVAGLIPSQTSVYDYLEGVGKARPFTGSTYPFIAVPTTAGTGSETTKNAVLSRLGEFKKSFRDDKLLAQEVWLDPRFVESCPGQVRYATGMDAFTQLLESYTTRKANPFTDALAWQGMQLFQSVKAEFLAQPSTPSNKLSSHLMLAASFSGITLANAGLGAVHGLAGPIGAFFEAPHGEVCAALLAPITQANLSALEAATTPEAIQTLKKYARIGQLFNPNAQTQAQQLSSLIDALTELAAPLQGLSTYGLTSNTLDAVIENCRAGSMLGNPIVLSDTVLRHAILQAL